MRNDRLTIAKAISDGFFRIVNARTMAMQFPDTKHGKEKDSEALKGDWYAVGQDIRAATRDYGFTISR